MLLRARAASTEAKQRHSDRQRQILFGKEGSSHAQAQGCGLTDFFLTLLLGAPEPKMAGAAPHRSGDTFGKWGSTVGLIAFVVIVHSQGLP